MHAEGSRAVEVSILEPKFNILNIANGLISQNYGLWVLPGDFLLLEDICKGNFGYCQNVPNMPIDHRPPLELLYASLLNIYFRQR